MLIKFGEYAPDTPDIDNSIDESGHLALRTANNVIPYGQHYGPFLDFTAQATTGMSTACLGGYSTGGVTRTPINFTGDAAHLYTFNNSSFTDVSVGGGYATGTDEIWQFTQFGNKVISTNFTNVMQVYDLASSSTFANLGGTPPQARNIGVVKSAFVVASNTYDAVDGNQPTRVRWSANGNEADWTVSAVTQSDYQDLKSTGGWINAFVGGEVGTIFQDTAITLMTYEGSPTVFRFDEIHSNKAGTRASRSVVQAHDGIFYYGPDGFYVLQAGQIEPIGNNRIDQAFARDLNNTYMQNIIGCVHPSEKIIFWLYPSTASQLGTPDKILMFNYSPGAVTRWTTADINLEFLYLTIDPGYTLEQLDAISTSLDTLPYSLDSRFWQRGGLSLGAINTSHKFGRFAGSALTATLATKEVQLNPEGLARVNEIRPLVTNDGTTASISIALSSRMLQTNSISYNTAVSMNSSGKINTRSTGRYHSAQTSITNGFGKAIGFHLEKSNSQGKR